MVIKSTQVPKWVTHSKYYGKEMTELGMVAHACDISIGKVQEVGRSKWQGHLHNTMRWKPAWGNMRTCLRKVIKKEEGDEYEQ